MAFWNHKILALFFFLLLTFSFGCSKGGFSSSSQSSLGNPSPNDDGGLPDHADAYAPLSWESTVKDGADWSMMIYKIILADQPSLLTSTVNDISTFCPRYDTLSKVQKTNFWGQLISAMAKFESGWKPTSRFLETSMGNDVVTGTQIVSEGLLQLSYQDSRSTSGYCDFDWVKDKPLHDVNPEDPRITILDPYKNLRCGIAILARQVRSKKAIAVDEGAYWSVIKPGSSHNKIPQISALTKSLSFCE